jgi:glycosyltransferase A (GT-A) superfamily protein (DUF2064 family)
VSGALAIFVKTPGLSAVKTRLAAEAGAAFAEAWHTRAAAAVAEVGAAAARAEGAEVYWAVAEPAAVGSPAWTGFPHLAQGEGGLGARMGRVHAELVRRHGHGTLLGADTPQLAVAHLRAALRWCAEVGARQAIGPARDGGFWLYASNRATPPGCWEAVAYSRADTARAFRAAFTDRGEWLELPTLTDVDRATDLAPMERELAALAAPLPAQRALADWLAAGALAGGALS